MKHRPPLLVGNQGATASSAVAPRYSEQGKNGKNALLKTNRQSALWAAF